MITPRKTHIRDHPTQPTSNKYSWILIFLSSANPSKKPSQIPSTMLPVIQWLKPSGTPSHFPNQQPSEVPTLPLLERQARNFLTFLVVDQVITLVAVHQLIWVCIPFICQLSYQPQCLQMFQVKNPVTSQLFISYRLQLVSHVLFRLFNIAISQHMLQLCTQAVDQVTDLLILQSYILASTLVYHSHKPHLSLQLPILVPFSWYIHHSTLQFILDQ